MARFFYTKLITVDYLFEEMETLDLSDEEKSHLSNLIESSIHHTVLDQILSHLSDDDRKLFLMEFAKNPEDEKLLEFLNQKVENIEDKIKQASDDLVKKMHQDVKQSKKI